MILVSIDPGKDTGWARFFGGKLEACGLGTPPLIKGARVVIELPQYRANDRIDPNDLISLAVKVGREVRRAEELGCTIDLPWPTDWKGNVPKKIHHPRIKRALGPLEAELLEGVLDLQSENKGHNVTDAVGIGLWALKRLAR